MTDQVKVTAADREFAEAVLRLQGEEHAYLAALLEGNHDNDMVVILAARHRIASQEQAVRAAIEAAAYKATSFLVGNPKEGISLRSPSPHAIADAIRALDPAQITKGLSDD